MTTINAQAFQGIADAASGLCCEILKDEGFSFSDYDACVAVLGKLKKAVLTGPFPTPDLFKKLATHPRELGFDRLRR